MSEFPTRDEILARRRPWRLEAPRRDRSGAPTGEWRVVSTYTTEQRAEFARMTYRDWRAYRVVKHVSFEAES